MNLSAHYDAMRQAALPQLARGAAALDPLLDSAQDSRRGITLLARPPAAITDLIEGIMADFQFLEPGQYYYPVIDIHLTILSIISCYPGFTLALIDPARYQAIVHALLQARPPFRIRFAGLTASPGGIMMQGFPQDAGLANLRDAMRAAFRQSGLPHSIDQRYSIQTAHATIIRFRTKLLQPKLLVEKIEQYESLFIGSFEVNTLELVYNDWYQRAQHTVVLEKYSLG
ncbi:mutarotase [Hymenobacter sp. HMF4947]|uniref:Mutarotase n=1 Tax=Hymenobacter ginkgonis TaxID=2682976 RepID=A0A7K1TB63_9BACT|nr:mutarotase [Hymenobacter ginkgonis]MVN75625.1 mutarotase [Hymenobacter ginkgonis]